ncbi:uncharacterized protein LOC123275348 [Cotesia glomerata]|uniref:uncharacterized protein LOC123275348 n=1 Tax=Cotesia glomerata TaxID=32391 RepID=UPI001D0225AB|nr:uncharacterized protein LOC123275348 [Cotesia glomerata]
MPKTNAEMCRQYRRKKNEIKMKKNSAKSSTERSREFRARKKQLLNNQNRCSDISVNVTDVINDHSQQQNSVPTGYNLVNNDYNPPVDVQPEIPYSRFRRNKFAHKEFNDKFLNNMFGHKCSVCDRLWFKLDLKSPRAEDEQLLRVIVENYNTVEDILLCNTCYQAIGRKVIPIMSTYNGFKYEERPEVLPPLDLISERLVSPRVPFMQIRRLRHVHGQYGIYGQIINVPVEVNNMVKLLPRNVDDDYCINVHIKRKIIHRSSYLMGLVNKRTIRAWLQYLLQTPLYLFYDIKIDESFFNNNSNNEIDLEEMSEDIPVEESLTAQQKTLLWNEDMYLRIAPGEYNIPKSIIFDEHAEELSFPSIYLGHFRKFREGVNATPFAIATSELRRSDRRGVTPHHLLYLAMKIMRLRVCDSLTIAFKHVGKNTNITRQQVESADYINNCIESNLAFLRSIPNSVWYWSDRKRDLLR